MSLLHTTPYHEFVHGSPAIQLAFVAQLLLPPVLSYKATSADVAGQGVGPLA